MLRIAFTCLWAAGLFSLSAQESGGRKSALDKATLEAYVRHLVLYGPQVQVAVADPEPSRLPGFLQVKVKASAGNVSEERIFYVSKDGKNIIQGNVFDVSENPFQREIEKLKTESQPMLGTPDAPVVIVVFSDFQCGYCREEGRMLREEVMKEYPTEVRVYFKDFPLSQIHPWARPASVAGRCVFRQNPSMFWDYHDWIFGKQAEITPENFRDKAAAYAESKSLDTLQFTRCLDSKSAEAEVERSLAEGRELGVNATPTLFINGRRIAASIPWQNLKQVVDLEIGHLKSSQSANEKCCEVKLPNPLSP